MRINRGLLGWGVFLIVLGAVPLAIRLNVIDTTTAAQLIRLWPLILVGIGLGLMLRFTPLASLGSVVVAATAGLLLGAVLAGGPAGFSGACLSNDGNAPPETRSSRAIPSGSRLELHLELSCVDLEINQAQADEWVVRTDFSGDRFRLDSQPARLALTDQPRAFLGAAARRAVEVTLPASPFAGIAVGVTLNAATGTFDPGHATLNGLGFTLNASDMTLDLSQAALGAGLGMTLNASSATLVMPVRGADSSIGITLNASSLNVCLAPDLDLEINASETLSSNNFAEAGLTRVGDRGWRFDGPGPRLALNYTGNVSSITLDRSGGCQ